MAFLVPSIRRSVAVLAFLAGAMLPTPCCSFPWNKDKGGGGDNEYEAPQDDQLRTPCPAINAAANHGYIDRSGKNIQLQDLSQALDDIFGIPTMAIMAFINEAFPLFGIETEMTEEGEMIDLDVLYTHMGLEHDASMVREDLYFAGDRASFSQELYDQCFDKDTMTVWALAACNRARILDSRKNNPEATDINLGGLIAAIETSLMMFFGDSPLMIKGSKDDFESFFKFGRIPDGYHRRSIPELAAIILPLSVTVPSGLKALNTPLKKSDDGSAISSPAEVPEELISIFKTLMVDYSSTFPKPFVAFMEAMLAELEQY